MWVVVWGLGVLDADIVKDTHGRIPLAESNIILDVTNLNQYTCFVPDFICD